MYLSIKDVAKRVGVAEETVRRWIRDGRLAAEDMGGRNGYRIKIEDWEIFINKRSAIGSAATGVATNLSKLGSLGATGISAIYSAVTKLNKDGKNSAEVQADERKFEIQRELINLDAEFAQYKIGYEAKKKTLELEMTGIEKLLKEHF